MAGSKAMRDKNNLIDMLKGLAIFLVVYGHVIQRAMLAQGEDFFLNPAFKIIYTFHMPLFIFISGYLMAFSVKRRGLAEVFKSRCGSLLLPFGVWGMLGILTEYGLMIMDGKNLVKADLFHSAVDQLLAHPSLWFLSTLFVLSAAVLFSQHWQKRLGLLSFLVVYVLIMCVPFNDFAGLYYIKWFYVFYAAGYLLNGREVNITKDHAVVCAAAVFVFIGLVSQWSKSDYIYVHKMLFASTHLVEEIVRIGYRYAAGFAGILIAFYVVLWLAKTKMAGVLSVIGIYSLDIYLIQRYILEGLYPRVMQGRTTHFDFNSPVVLYVLVPATAALFTGLCVAISKFLIRRNHLLNRLLLGGRS